MATSRYQSSSHASSTSSSVVDASFLKNKFCDWEETLKDVSHSGCAESEESLNPNHIDMFVENGKIYYRSPHTLKRIKYLKDIPSKVMHFKEADARFAKPNGLEIARIEALTRLIYNGEIRITGDYACVNHLGTYPSNSAPELKARSPVPIKLWYGLEGRALIDRHEVTVAGTKKTLTYVCHFKGAYSPSEGAEELSRQRIYFAGFQSSLFDRISEALVHYNKMQSRTPWSSGQLEVKAEQKDVTIVGLNNGLLTAYYNDYKDGVVLEYSPSENHIIGTSIPSILSSAHRYPYTVWESCPDNRHISIISDEDVKGVWEYKTTVWIALADSGMNCLVDYKMQRAARAFKGLTLERYGQMVGASLVDVIASFQRMSDPFDGGERSVGGHSCYLYQGDTNYKISKDHIVASAMRRDELEGVVVVSTPHGDYSLRTGAKVKYTCDDDGVWYMGPEGHMESIAPSDLVGAKLN